MQSTSKLWVGRSEDDVVVFDPSVQERGSEYVVLWDLATRRFDSYRAAVFRNWVKKADEATAAQALRAYGDWKELNKREEREALVRRHAQFLAARGLHNAGVREAAASERHRATHCYACKESLDSRVDAECLACNWIICSCGACGCGYSA